jgi:hypothetical protein
MRFFFQFFKINYDMKNFKTRGLYKKKKKRIQEEKK